MRPSNKVGLEILIDLFSSAYLKILFTIKVKSKKCFFP
jgi:hypothetical protein